MSMPSATPPTARPGPPAPAVPLPLVATRGDAEELRAQEARRPDRTYVTVMAEAGCLWVGPLRRPMQPGCAHCLSVRRAHIHLHRAAFLQLRDQAPPAPLDSDQVAALASRLAVLDREDQRAVFQLDLHTRQATLRFLLPVSDCPVCDQRRLDERPAPVTLPAVPKPSPGTFRAPSEGLEERWQALYVDEEIGLIRDVRLHPQSLFHDVTARAGMPGFEQLELTSGRNSDPAKARLAAVAEALERYGGIRPYSRRTSVYGRYADLQHMAVDPARLGQHCPDALAAAGSSIRPFDPSEAMPWVWATSLLTGEARVLPERYVYYGLPHLPGSPLHFYETSSGCAVGRTLTEAAFYGLLELVERDAFLLTWYARVPARRLELRQGLSPALAWSLERIETRTGYRMSAYDITLEIGIPAVWMMARDHSGHPDRPATLHAAAAHLSPSAALAGALHELAPSIPYAARQYPGRRPELLSWLAHPERVTGMADHAAVYWLPEAAPRLGFLDGGAPTTLAGMTRRAPAPTADLRDDLAGLLERFSGVGLDVWMVDQTAAEHRAGGLHCVKIVVPGLLPMTFGHAHRRLLGLPRLESVPALLGRTTPAPLNPHPHPFP